jgi:hypothetical protein
MPAMKTYGSAWILRFRMERLSNAKTQRTSFTSGDRIFSSMHRKMEFTSSDLLGHLERSLSEAKRQSAPRSGPDSLLDRILVIGRGKFAASIA